MKEHCAYYTQFARQVATPYSFISSLPDEFHRVVSTRLAFVGRPPQHPWAEDISIANHRTIMMMLRPEKMYEILSQPTEQRLVDLVNAFLEPEIDGRKLVRTLLYSTHCDCVRLRRRLSVTDDRYALNTATQFKFEVDSLEDSNTRGDYHL